jgi:hypothetical protein
MIDSLKDYEKRTRLKEEQLRKLNEMVCDTNFERSTLKDFNTKLLDAFNHDRSQLTA